MRFQLIITSVLVNMLMVIGIVQAAWTPLITSDSFTGIQTDVLTTATGVMSVILIVLGIGILYNVLLHK